jgi:hypothetical protein
METDITAIESGKTFRVYLSYVMNNKEHDYTGAHVSINIKDHYGSSLYNHHNLLVNEAFSNHDLSRSDKFIVTIKNFPLAAGTYTIGINIFQVYTAIDGIDNASNLDVVASNAFNYKNSPDPGHGMVLMETEWCLG